ncbi:hypothetical protein J6590_000798 [Homalodisca vitripennis]|nr:hypothetical protein J6590_000798 [Homalodisca vitripennis]
MANLADKSVCIVCYKKVIDKGVECDSACKRWFHPDCVKITAGEYKKIADGTTKNWSCGRVDCVDSQSAVIEFLRNFDKNVLHGIDPDFADVRVSRDRTPRERDHLNSLRDQLKVRSEKGEKNLTIRYVNGTPKIMKQASKN